MTAARRRGKQIWCELDAPPFPLFHLGMTGTFRAPDDEGILYEAGAKKVDTTWPPKFTKVHFFLEDGGEFVMTNARRLGRIRMRENPEAEPPISRLGFDPLLDLPGPADFSARLRARRGVLKAVLLDQSFAAGVGNWIADEVLYQAKIDPRRRGDSLSDAEARRIRSALKRIVARACDVNADKAGFPGTWLFHRRWGRDAGAKTHDGHPVIHVEIGGRTTAFAPHVQH